MCHATVQNKAARRKDGHGAARTQQFDGEQCGGINEAARRTCRAALDPIAQTGDGYSTVGYLVTLTTASPAETVDSASAASSTEENSAVLETATTTQSG